jgi:hypothetical protein
MRCQDGSTVLVGGTMSRFSLATVMVIAGVLTLGVSALAYTGALGLLGAAGKVTTDTIHDQAVSLQIPVDNYETGMSLVTPAGPMSDSASFSVKTEQVRGLSDLHPRMHQRFRGRALSVPLGQRRHLIALLFAGADADGRAKPLPWLSADGNGTIPSANWPVLGIWDGTLFREIDPAASSDLLATLRMTSRKVDTTSVANTAVAGAPEPLEGLLFLPMEKPDGTRFRLGVSRDQFHREDF